jgi:hypothetical protein
MKLTLEELNVWADAAEMASLSGNPVAVTSRELKSLIAAARAHLEGQELHKADAERFWHPQPPQQREDDVLRPGDIGFSGSSSAYGVLPLDNVPLAPPPSSTVEPSLDYSLDPQANAGGPYPKPSPDTNFSKRKSEDAGLVWLTSVGLTPEWFWTCSQRDQQTQVLRAAAAALEAKDAEIQLAWNTCEKAEIRARHAQAEIERLREALEITRATG